MHPRYLTVLATFGLLLATLAVSGQAQEGTTSAPSAHQGRTAAAIVAEVEGLTRPAVDAARRSDPEYRKEYAALTQAYEARRAGLALELWSADPGHAQLVELLGNRWRYLSSGVGDFAAVAEETTRVQREAPGSALAIEAAYHGAWGIGMATKFETASFLPAIERFAALAPDDARLSQMLLTAGDNSDNLEVQRTLLARVAQGADARLASRAKSQLVQLEGIGKPFELAFNDVTTGKPIAMQDYRGQVVVIDFWATWCKPCVAELPRMKDLYADYKPRGVEFIGVSLDKSEQDGGRQRLLDFVADNTMAWPQYYQGKYWDGDFSKSWGINSIPALFVVDSEGNLDSTNARQDLEDILERLAPIRG